MLTPDTLAALQPWIDHWRTRLATAGLAESADYWGLIRELHDPNLTWPAFLGYRTRLTTDYYLDSATVSRLSRLYEAEREPFTAILEQLSSDDSDPRATSGAEDALQVLAKAADLAVDGREKIERTLAAYLTLRAPERHCFYLGAARSGVINATGVEVGDGYAGWRALALDLAEHLRAQAEIVRVYRAALTPADYPDEAMLHAAYDLLFCGSRLSGLGALDPLRHIPSPGAIGKVSMSASAVPDGVYREARRRRVVLVHGEPRGKGRSAETQADPFCSFRKNDWFYLCRGNERIELLGRFLTDEAVPSGLRPNGDASWFERPYMRIGYPAKFEPYRGESRWWTPNDDSTCRLVPREAWLEADALLLEPYFKINALAAVEAYQARTQPKAPSAWTGFYERIADALQWSEDDRPGLAAGVVEAFRGRGGDNVLVDQFADGTSGPLRDIDPFTAIAIFNRQQRDAQRTELATALAALLSVDEAAPTAFAGVPTANNQSTWFFAYAKTRSPDAIDRLWDVFRAAMSYAADVDDAEAAAAFAKTFDAAQEVRQVGWKLTIGLFWVRPYAFVSLDRRSREYITDTFGFPVDGSGAGGRITGAAYVRLLSDLREAFGRAQAPVNSFPELVLAATTSESALQDHPETLQTKMNPTHPLNQILYGPPGTGKTYATRKLAVEICDGSAPQSRGAVRTRYEELVTAGRIVFTTFHQSMSYEDFVEGIKPEVVVGGQVSYGVKDGVFKRMANGARETVVQVGLHGDTELPTYNSEGETQNLTVEEAVNLAYFNLSSEEKYDLGFSALIARTKQSAPIPTELSAAGKASVWITVARSGHSFEVRKARNANDKTYMKFDRVREAFHGNQNGNTGTQFENVAIAVIKRLSREAFDKSFNPKRLSLSVADNSQSRSSATATGARGAGGSPAAAPTPHVLIIDEINRGNVAAIFGELITLLEEDKRLGADEELTVTLPYSKERFGVPGNLFLIGTMNTADRSVEALDAALRRRFEFEEMRADANVIRDVAELSEGWDTIEVAGAGVSLPDLLNTINHRVELLRDRHHHIGHSFFLGLRDAQDLRTALERKVIPLLQEYFFGEDDKLELILGSGFCRKASNSNTSPFAPGVTSDYADLPDHVRYDVGVPQDDMAFLKALRALDPDIVR